MDIGTSQRSTAVETAAGIMLGFAARTGLTGDHPQQRYLWTDAFAVCNFLALAAATGQQRYATLALGLVDRVHQVLGRHRSDDPRTGWLSGLGEREGESRPTLGGLRIGKKLRERSLGEPYDERLEWDRDGQYFHYLTKWMHALDQVSRATREPRFNLWARELAVAAHAAFVYRRSERTDPRMIWKASIDLSRPLVTSMGQHDPLDGLVTYAQLRATARRLPGASGPPSLDEPLADFAAMIDERNLATVDPLGLGGLLMDAGRLAQLVAEPGTFVGAPTLLETSLAAALAGIDHYAHQAELRQPASGRLAFRELGCAIGLHALSLIHVQLARGAEAFARRRTLWALLEELSAYVPLASAIEAFWLEPEHQSARTWCEHREINEVMLASSLVPEGCLLLARL